MSEQQDADGGGTAVRILDVAERMLQVRGYNGFSYGDVAAELGITRAALHYHFKGKAELGQALIERYAGRFATALAALDETAPDATVRLRGYADLYLEVLSRERMCLCGMLAAEYQTLPAPLQAAVAAFFERNTGWLRRVLEQGSAEGSLHLAGRSEDVAAMVLGGLEGAMLLTRLDGDVARFSAAADRLIGGLTRGPGAAERSGAAAG